MKKIKHLLCCLMAFVGTTALSVSLTACGGNETSSTPDSSIESPNDSSTPDSSVEEEQGTPTLSLNVESVAVDLNEEITVTASVAIGDKAVDAATLNWAIVSGEATDVVSLTPADNTLSATIKGLKYGTTTISVSALVGDQPLLKTLQVTCGRLGVTFEVEGLTYGDNGYPVALGLIAVKDHVDAYKPVLTVFENDVEVSNPTITWTTEDASIATVDADGTIHAVAAGDTVITANYGGNGVNFAVNVYRPVVEMEGTVQIETARTESLAKPEGLVGEVTEIVLNDANIMVSASDDAFAIDKEALPTEVTSMGEKTITFETAKASYVYAAEVYTMIIQSAADLDAMGAMSKAAMSDVLSWGGYFVLGADIEYNKEFVPFISYGYFVENDATGMFGSPDQVGFKGIFDGRGHKIDGMQMNTAGAGFIGIVSNGGVIRNVSFTNAVNNAAGGFLSTASAGTYENIFISGTQAAAVGYSWDPIAWIVSTNCYNSSKIQRVIVEVKSETATSFNYGLGKYPDNVLSEAFIIGSAKWYEKYAEGAGNIGGAYAGYGALKAEGLDFSAWYGDFWKEANGLPYPKNVETTEVELTASVSDVNVGTEVAVNTNLLFNSLSLDAAAVEAGVTINGSTIVIPDNSALKGTSFTVTATQALTGATKSLTFNVLNATKVDAEDRELSKYHLADNFTIDLTQYNITGTNVTAMAGASAFATASFADGILTLDKASLPASGSLNIVATITGENGATTTVTIPVTVYTMIISTVEDLNNFPAASAAASSDDKHWSGHFVLANDIYYNDQRFAGFISYGTLNEKGYGAMWNDPAQVGFNGIFDGRGHKIDGIYFNDGASGFLGVIAEGGILRNIAFTNSKHAANGGFISSACGGTVENVYISAVHWAAGFSWDPVGWFTSHGYTMNCKIKNVVIEAAVPSDVSTEFIWGIGKLPTNAGFLENVYVVASYALYKEDWVSGSTTDVGAAYTDRAAWSAAGIDYSSWNKDFWTLVDGLPIAKCLVVEK